MATLTIKNVPDNVYERLKQQAKKNRRSINNEAIVILENVLPPQQHDVEKILEEARKIRKLTAHYVLTDEELNKWKNEGRP
ncbi:MAG TPA: Arc family DNA-binding protein [Anaerolineae bacterium]|nr:Arc family DNA-binding protein [Anaerolineae bacterium]